MDPYDYWKQMLQAVQVIHEEKIVHSDFVLVKGQLKLIDFGIANAIANDTTNIQRDHQIGTVNYMSPEAIELPEGMRRLKVGRPSDVWSLGCILYQMVYGQPPFHAYNVYAKMKVIPDENYIIDLPEYAISVAQMKKDAVAGGSSKTRASESARTAIYDQHDEELPDAGNNTRANGAELAGTRVLPFFVSTASTFATHAIARTDVA